jgi:hypothetical protein
VILDGSGPVNLDTISALLADLKKRAKASPEKLALDYAGATTPG